MTQHLSSNTDTLPQVGDTLHFRDTDPFTRVTTTHTGVVTQAHHILYTYRVELPDGRTQFVNERNIIWRSTTPVEQAFDFYQEITIMIGTHGQVADAVVLDIEDTELLVATTDESYLWIPKSDVLQTVALEEVA